METLGCFVMIALCVIGIGFLLWAIFLLVVNSVSFSITYILLGLLFLGITAIMFIIWCKYTDKENEKIKSWKDSMYLNNNVDEENIKFKIVENIVGVYLVYFNNKKLFFVNEENRIFNEINLNEILKIDIQAITQEKTKQEILTLTPTFYTQKTILSYRLKIITESKTTIITVAPTYDNKELLERFKLVLERDIKEVTGNSLNQ